MSSWRTFYSNEQLYLRSERLHGQLGEMLIFNFIVSSIFIISMWFILITRWNIFNNKNKHKFCLRSECFQLCKTVSRKLPVHGAVQERGEGVGEVDGEEVWGRRTAGGLQASSAPPRHRPGLLSPVQHRDDGLTGAEPGRHDLTVELQRLLHELGGDGKRLV